MYILAQPISANIGDEFTVSSPHCQFAPVTPPSQVNMRRVGITSKTFSGYLLVLGTQLNKQQLTTGKVSVGQSWKASGATSHLGRVGRAS